ncbi:fibronectin type III domain-containing protein [Tenacibaculum ovolyticum]|uniref:fibronectin type III domain-containing protein n=1 Tax=Tenacibaculum ovolyticum TaxID=104270 RepID=UPI001EED51FE|nr:fibronectin type III domain-containing protein [Tenacibaculum ovolyticum]
MKTSPNYKNIQQRLLLIVSIFLNTLLFAQTYPVQVNPQLIPPYSLKISDYATTTSEKLYLNILLTDINEVGRRVRLKMYIEGQGLAISTQEVIMGETPIFLNGGINTRLSNVDLQAYFQLNNLIGITPQQFNNPLPNGGYDFCFEVYDYFTNRKLSGKSCTTAYLLQNDPPILNLPFKNNIVTATNPQNILFTWTPRHTNANNVQYEYTLKELWDVQNPQASFLASIPFYQTTTYSTTLLVGPEAPQLMSGKIYGWQVRAFVSDGINETSVFKNDGKSEIFWFKYLKDCSAPSFVISQALTAESVQINWQASAHIRYRIQYRKKGFGDYDWFDVNSYTNEGKIFNLEADTVYEFRVGGECTQLSGFAYSNIQEFTTPTTDEAAYYNCGLTPEINITNNDPLPKLGVNETFTAGDFPVITRKVTGSNGTFSGWGYITLPFLENIKEIIDAVNILTDDGTEEKKGNINIGKYTRIKVTFSGISINTSYELTKGLVQTDYDPEWGGILDLDAVIDDVFGDDGETNSFDASNIDIKTVTVNADGAIVITTENGETQIITSDKPVRITDKNGDQWTVKEDGTVIKGKVAEGGVPTKNNTEGISSAGNVTEISSKDVRVKFITSGYYSNDIHNESITSSKYKKQYEFVKTHDDKEYSVLYKLVSDVSSNKTDVVKAEVSFANGKTKKDIVFKTKQGVKIDSSWSDNVVTLKLKREFEFAKDEIIATVKPKDSTKKYTVAGKLNIWHAKERSINLTLVSVNKANTDGVKKRINEIYNKAGINFNITTDNIKLDLDKLDVGDSDMISNYTQGQKNIISAYKNKAKKEQYYIFFLDEDVKLSKKNVEGFMPLKRQFGFVFTQKDPGRIAAHEIGHGIFGLKHPWDQYNTKKGESTYLMDSGTSGTDFTHMDWQKLHAPGIQLYIFQGDEAGESATVKDLADLKEFINLDNKSYSFISSFGKIITLPNSVSNLTFSTGDLYTKSGRVNPIGSLIAFTLNSKRYKQNITVKGANDIGYLNVKEKYKDTLTSRLDEKKIKPIIGRVVFNDNGSGYAFQVTNVANFEKVSSYFNTFSKDKLKGIEGISKLFNSKSAILDVPVNYSKEFDNFFVQSYLEKNKENAKSSSPYTSYIFGLSSLIHKNPKIHEVCNSSSYEAFEKEFPVISSLKDLSSYSSDNQIMRIFRNVEKQDDYYKKYFKIYLKAPALIKKINTEELSVIKIEEIVESLEDCQCSLKLITFEKRLKIYNKLIKSNLSDYETTFISLLYKTPEDQLKKWYDVFSLEKNQKSIISIYKNLGSTNREIFIHFLTKLTKKFGTIPDNYSDNYNSKITYNGYKPVPTHTQTFNIKNKGLLFDCEGVLNGQAPCESITTKTSYNYAGVSKVNDSEIRFTHVIKRINSSKSNQIEVDHYYYQGSPMNSFVKINFLSDFNYAKIKSNETHKVPLFWAYHFANKHNENVEGLELKFAIATASLMMTPFTGGGSLLMITEGVLAGGEIIITFYDDDIRGLEHGESFIKVWEIAGASLGGFEMVKGVLKFRPKEFFISLKGKANDIRLSNLNKLKNLFNGFKKLKIGVGKELLDLHIKQVSKTIDIQKSIVKGFDDSELIVKNYNSLHINGTAIGTLEYADEMGGKLIANIPDSKFISFSDEIASDYKKLGEISLTRKKESIEDVFEVYQSTSGVVRLRTLFDLTKKYRKVGFDEFIEGTYALQKLGKTKETKEVFRLWTKVEGDKANEAAGALFDYMKKNKINLDGDGVTPWPPYNGFLSKPDVLIFDDYPTNLTFDRFQGVYKGESVMELRGGFASPVPVEKGYYNFSLENPYTYGSRALLDNVVDNTVYIKFKLLKTDNISFKIGESLPWKTRKGEVIKGNAKQIQSNINLGDLEEDIDYIIMQRSVFKNNKWVDDIPDKTMKDLSKKIDNLLKDTKFCK